MNIHAQVATDVCQHSQDEGQDVYAVLEVRTDNKAYSLRVPMTQYGSDAEILALFQALAAKINS